MCSLLGLHTALSARASDQEDRQGQEHHRVFCELTLVGLYTLLLLLNEQRKDLRNLYDCHGLCEK